MFPGIKYIRRLFLPALLLGSAGLPVFAAPTALNPVNGASTLTTLSFSWTDVGGPYVAAISTDSNFLVTTSSGIRTTPASYPGLDQDTTYYFRVKKQSEGDASYAINTATLPTVAAAPTGMYFNDSYFTAASSFTATVNAGWAINGNQALTRYEVSYDTVFPFTSAVVVPETSPQGTPQDIGGLSANTTYYMTVRTRGVNGALTAETSPISTSTLAMDLPVVSAGVFETTATVSWSLVNDGSIQTLQSEGYRLILSLSDQMTALITDWSSYPDATVASKQLTGLASNTTYFYAVNTINWNGVSDLRTKRSFTTLALQPQNLALVSVSSSAARLTWDALANAQGYRLEGSSVNFNGSDTPLYTGTQNLFSNALTLNDLEANTTYNLRAASVNQANKFNYTAALSTITLAPPPSTGMQYVYAETDALTVLIFPLPGPLQRNSCEGYRLMASSTNFNGTGVLLSSSTPNPQPLTLGFSGLRPHTPYYLRLGTLNWDGTPNYTDLPATATKLPDPPSGVKLVSIWESTATVNFSGISGGDSYTLEASTHEFFDSIQLSSATSNSGVSTLTVSGLDLNTRYYFRMAALYNGATVYMTATPSNRSTLPASLGAALFAGVFYSSVTVSWTPLASSPPKATAESYLLEAATTQAFTQVLFSSSTGITPVSRLTLTSLSPNTSYYFRAGSVNWDGAANYSVTPATATMANAPTQLNFTLTPLSITPVWLTNSNPPDTRYLAEIDTNGGFSSIFDSSTTVLSSATFSALSPNTTYYTRVTALNRFNRASPTIIFSPMATGAYYALPAAPTNVDVSSLTVNWLNGPNPLNITDYRVQISSHPDYSGLMLSSVTANLYSVFGGLASNTSYYMRVSALNLMGVPVDPPVDLPSALTRPATPYILAPEQTFSDLLTDGFSVNWLDNNNSSVTVYNVRVSTVQDFSLISSSLSIKALSCNF